MIWELIIVVCAFALTAKAQSPTLDTDTALYVLYGILVVSALFCVLLATCIICFCCKIWRQRGDRTRRLGDSGGDGKLSKKKTPGSLRLFTGPNSNEVAAAGNEGVQLKHLLSISSDISEGVSTPPYDPMSTFKPVVEDEAEVEGEKSNTETNFNLSASKPSLASAAEVDVDVTETQEGFEARKEKAKILRQLSQEHPPNPLDLLRDETEVHHRGLGRKDSLSQYDLPGACAMEEKMSYSKSEGDLLDSQPGRDREDSPSMDEKREQFESQKHSAKKNRKGKRVLHQRDSVQALLAPTPSSESELPAFPEFGDNDTGQS